MHYFIWIRERETMAALEEYTLEKEWERKINERLKLTALRYAQIAKHRKTRNRKKTMKMKDDVLVDAIDRKIQI